MLGTSDAWSMSRSSHRPSKPAYYIEDWRISEPRCEFVSLLQFDENFFLTSTRSVEGPVKSVGFRIWVNSTWNMSSFALRHSVNGLVLYTNRLIYKVQKDKVCKNYVATYVTKVDFRNSFSSIEFIYPWPGLLDVMKFNLIKQ